MGAMRGRNQSHMTTSNAPALIGVLALVICAFLANGCASTNATNGSGAVPRIQTTMLGSVDLVRMTDQMAASLLSSDVDFENQPFIIVTDRVVNRTNHIIDQGEKEHFLVRLRSILNQNESLGSAGVTFVARPDEMSEWSVAMREDQAEAAQGPTHALTATFTTLTNVDRTIREDTYECAFQLQDLRSREVVWEDAYEVRYAVRRGKTQ